MWSLRVVNNSKFPVGGKANPRSDLCSSPTVTSESVSRSLFSERKGGKKDASGADYRNRKSFPQEADIFAGHSIIETCSPRLLQGQELQAHWFPHPQRWVCGGARKIAKLCSP